MQSQNLKYFLYARKSSEDEDRQIQSIDDQVNWLIQKANQTGVVLKKNQIFTEAKSAKKPNNRPVFAEMLARIEKGEANALLVWDISRLSRNPIDSAAIQWLLQEGKLRLIHTHTREYRPEDNTLLYSVESGMANQYIIELRANTQRGINSKLEKGWKPGLAPVGYINNPDPDERKGEKTIIPDPERFDIVRKAWDLMLTGNYNPRQIHQIATEEWHLTTKERKTKRGKVAISRTISHNGTYRLLTNIFYAKVIDYGGKIYEGSHKPMITMAEFDRVQMLLGAKGRPRPQSREHSYTGSITCGECSAQVTAETKTKFVKKTGQLKDYVYYRCTHRKTGVPCKQRPIRLEDLEPQMDAQLRQFTILPVFRDWALEKLNRSNDQEIVDRTKVQESLTKALDDNQQQLDNLTKMRYRDMIDDDEFKKEKKALQTELARLQQERDGNEGRARNWLKLTEDTFKFACYAQRSFMFGDVRTKREIFAALGKGATLKDGVLTITPHKWFQPIVENYAELEAAYEEVRTKKTANLNREMAVLINNWGE